MKTREKKELSFVKALGKEMRDTFPGFQDNPYYLERFNEEEKKLVRMQQKSSLVFMFYFTLLWTCLLYTSPSPRD